jgi:NAD(P)H dehydrogenase (quinone)
MKLVISGASAQIGRMVTEKLLQSIPPANLTLITRNPAGLSQYADQGVSVLPGHHGDAESLREGYKGADALLMISSRAGGQRARHNHESIQVAKSAGVKHITYTSCAGAHPSNPTPSSADHLGTEYSLFDSGLSFAAMRNQTYSDLLYNIMKTQVLPKKRMIMNCLHGALSPISRNDIANSAAAIMLAPEKHDRVVYEITGPERFTWPEIIDVASKVWETDLKYIAISTEEMLDIMNKVGIPFKGNPDSEIMAQAMGAEELALQADGYEMGFLDIVSAHVQWITGSKPQSLESVWREMKAAGL